MTGKPHAVVIGAGVAGLAAAIRLAARGLTVEVLERNDYPGGKLSAFSRNGYSFDAGPSLFTQPDNLRDLFRSAGKELEGYFDFVPVSVANQYFFPDGKRVKAYTDKQAFANEMETVLGEDPDAVTEYLEEAGRMYEKIGQIFLDYSLHRSDTWLHRRILPALAALRPGYLLSNLNGHNSRRFRTPEAVQIFNRFATYNGSNPYRTPAMLSMIPHLEMNEGTFYPKGGMISITKAMHRLAEELGVKFIFGTPAEGIIHHANQVSGVRHSGGQISKADVVVTNSDVYFTYRDLLGDSGSAKKVLKQERSSSAVIFYWGIGTSFPQLELHNIFFTGDYQREFRGIFGTEQMSDDPTVYINITSKMEPGLAPAGKENWFVMVNAPAHRGQDWPAMLGSIRANIIRKLNRMLGTDLDTLIETEDLLDPAGIESKTSSYMGSLYGTSSNSLFAAFLRHPNFRSSIRGLYFCGGSVHPGGGIPLCLKSARIVSKLAEADGF